MVDPFGPEGEAGPDPDGGAALGREDKAGLGTETDADTVGGLDVDWLLHPSTASVMTTTSTADRDWPLVLLSMEPDTSCGAR